MTSRTSAPGRGGSPGAHIAVGVSISGHAVAARDKTQPSRFARDVSSGSASTDDDGRSFSYQRR